MTTTDQRPVRVLLLSEGSYPFCQGGVATWCDMLVNDLPDVEFMLLSIIGDPRLRPQYALPENVVLCQPFPIWGLREARELREDLALSELMRPRASAAEETLGQLIWALLGELFGPGDAGRFAQSLHALYLAFQAYDFDTALRSRAVWERFVRAARELFPPAAAASGYAEAHCTLGEVADAQSLLYHWLMPLARPLPRADVAHAVSAGLCSMVGVMARLEYGTPLLLTEHGVYLRERYLAENEVREELFGKLFRTRFARLVTQASYLHADQISPGSNYNQRWEARNGALPARLRTIYNGVDPASMRPGPGRSDDAPVVVWVGRITPIKDLETMIRAAALVHSSRPAVRFRIFGVPPRGSEGYLVVCERLCEELGLHEALSFCGFAPSAEAAFNGGDIAALSSISEGFPYSVVEAMLCARPVVATAVGGVPEALSGCGITVEPRNPMAMADAIVSLVDDSALRTALGEAARTRASQAFNLAQCSESYRASYLALAGLPRPQAQYELAQPAAPYALATSSMVMSDG
jgi:polysaccharide biosynthesis protein PelF